MAGIWNDGKPDDALDDGDLSPLNGLNESSWEADKKQEVMDRWSPGNLSLSDWLNSLEGTIYHLIGQAFGGSYTGSVGPLIEITDKQQELRDRQDALMGAPGYCCLTMDHNWKVSFDNKWIPLPFNAQIGPNIGAKHFHERFYQPGDDSKSRHGIELTKGGLWLFYGRMFPEYHSTSGNITVKLRINIRRKNSSGNTYSYSLAPYRWTSGKGETHQISHAVVIPPEDEWAGDRYLVAFEWSMSANWWAVRGGTDNALFYASRLSPDSGSNPSGEVSDGGDYT